MNPVWIITGKEVRDSLCNRWMLAVTMLLAVLVLSLGSLGNTPIGSVKVNPLTAAVISLSNLSTSLIPLIVMLLSYDAFIGEIERGTIALLLSYSVSRARILVGKFISHVIVPTPVTAASYGSAGVALQLVNGDIDIAAWKPLALLIAASVVLDVAFPAMGCVISAEVKERGMVAGVAIDVRLFFVVTFDMTLLGVSMADSEQTIIASVVEDILLLNLVDIYRLLNLAGYENTVMYVGMAGLGEQTGLIAPVLLVAQILWVFVPLVLTAWIFGRRQI